MREKLLGAIDIFNSINVAVIGDSALDKYIFGSVTRINPENPGAPLLNIEGEFYRIGCAANVAANTASLGAKTYLYTLFGEDSHASIIRELCKSSNISLFAGKNGETIVKTRFLESAHGHYFMRTDDEKQLPITEELSEEIFSKLTSAQLPSLIVLSDYNKNVFRTNLSQRIIAWAKNIDIPVVAAPRPSNINFFKGATALCLNRKEASEITGLADSKDIAKKLLNEKYAGKIFITLSERGMLAYDGEFHEVPTKARNVADVTGAGDTALALIALSLASSLSTSEAANLANYAAGLVVEKRGTATVSREELIKRVHEDNQ